MPAIKYTAAPSGVFSAKIPDKAAALAFTKALHDWFLKEARALPWREKPSLYGTVVSEFMLQQTQIATALPYYHAWMARFPDFTALAQADEATVLKHWEGLGYYSRARNLHAAAKTLAQMSTPPQNAAQWQTLRGIGPYTAAAIASIAQGEPIALVDGNVVRVLTRLRGDATEYAGASAAGPLLQPWAQFLMDADAYPSIHNQAMMELGALLCTRHKAPACLLCPVACWCMVAHQADAQDYPFLAAKKIERIDRERLWITNDAGALLLSKAHAGAKRLASLWELPLVSDVPLAKKAATALLVKKRAISTQQITESIFSATLLRKDYPQGEQWVWADETTLQALPLSGPHRRWVNSIRQPR